MILLTLILIIMMLITLRRLLLLIIIICKVAFILETTTRRFSITHKERRDTVKTVGIIKSEYETFLSKMNTLKSHF